MVELSKIFTQTMFGTSKKISESPPKASGGALYAPKGVINAKMDVQKSKGSHTLPLKSRISSIDSWDTFFLWGSALKLRHV